MYCIPIGAAVVPSEYFGHDVTEGLVVIGHGPSIDVRVFPDVDAAAQKLIHTVAAAGVMSECG
eukprot:6651058-Pyramimonas_sp.AAC.1